MSPVQPIPHTSIRVITSKISQAELRQVAAETFEIMAKAVVDIEKRILAIGGELHADANAVLMERGSRQQDLWGINIYLNRPNVDRIEFIALINVRPTSGNRSMEVKDPAIRQRITNVVNDLIE